MWLYAVSMGYVAGVIIGLFFDIPSFPYLCLAGGIGFVIVLFYEERMRLAGAFLCIASFGYMHSHNAVNQWIQPDTDEFEVSGTAYVIDDPKQKDRSQEATLVYRQCADAQCPHQRVLGFFPIYSDLHYGDVLDVRCALNVPKNKSEDFDYRMFLAAKGIGWVCYPKEWHRIGTNDGNSALSYVIRIRDGLEKSLEQFVVYPESGLIKGLLFGGDSHLTQEMQDAFTRTGMSHIVAVSGANVAIISRAVFLIAIVIGFWRKSALFIALFIIAAFVLMVGAEASAVRAGIMGGLVLIAGYSGRISQSIRLWIAALVLMLMWNPLLLRYDLGFQLSFMATLGILLSAPLFDQVLIRRSLAGIRVAQEVLLMTLAAEIFVLPIIFFNFHMFSGVSLAANLLILPVLPFAMLFGFLASFTGIFFSPIANLFGLLAYLVSHYVLQTIHFLAGQDFASIRIDYFGWGCIFVWYICVGGTLLFLRKKYIFKS